MFARQKREASHSGEISLRETLPDLPDDAFELARFWVNSQRSYVAVSYADRWQPELLGSLLVESIHTAAAAYASHMTMSEDEALDRMWRGFDEERGRLAQ